MALPVRDQRTSRRPVCFSAKRMANFGADGASEQAGGRRRGPQALTWRTEPQVRCPCPAGPSSERPDGRRRYSISGRPRPILAGCARKPGPPSCWHRSSAASSAWSSSGCRAGRPILLGRSACDHCGRPLGPRDLVPLAELPRAARALRLRRGAAEPVLPDDRARRAWRSRSRPRACCPAGCCGRASALGWTLLALAAIDLRHYLLPDVLTLPLIPAGLAVAYALDPARLPDHALGAALGFAAFAAIGSAYRRLRGREGLGLGDAKLLGGGGRLARLAGAAERRGDRGRARARARLGGRARRR